MVHLPGKADHVLNASFRGDREFADTFQSIQLADRWARSLRFASQLNRRNPLIQREFEWTSREPERPARLNKCHARQVV